MGRLTTSMTCTEWSEPDRQSQLTSSLANLMGVQSSRLHIACEAQTAKRRLLALLSTSARSELNVLIFAPEVSTEEVSVEQAAQRLTRVSPTKIGTLAGFPADTTVFAVERTSLASATRPIIGTAAPSSSPGESGGLSGGAIFGIVAACTILLVLSGSAYKEYVWDPKQREKALLQSML